MGPFGPYGEAFTRAAAGVTDILVNKVLDEIFGDSGAARQTMAVVFNHTDWPLFFMSSSFESGNFTPGQAAPFQIEPKTAMAYKVESHGLFSGVTGADVRYGFAPQGPIALWIVTSNPYGGDNHENVQAYGGLHVVFRGSAGNFNQVEVDLSN